MNTITLELKMPKSRRKPQSAEDVSSEIENIDKVLNFMYTNDMASAKLADKTFHEFYGYSVINEYNKIKSNTRA